MDLVSLATEDCEQVEILASCSRQRIVLVLEDACLRQERFFERCHSSFSKA